MSFAESLLRPNLVRWAAPDNRTGRLIVICGSDGTGKTTQVSMLADRLSRVSGRKIICTRQPTDWYRSDSFVQRFLQDGGDSSQAVSLALFAAADRIRHCTEVIKPELASGSVIICDRYVYSSLVYFAFRGVSPELVASFNIDIPRPDVAVLLDVAPEDIGRRLQRRDGAAMKYEERSLSRISSIWRNYRLLGDDLEHIEGGRTPDEVHAAIWARCRALL